ncbi:hypothetical protein AVEN_82174-1 [Araneus ventricosus]|uniref:Uncharacterized protein n=1 Tax=Araneus ventricosus TaxID=182803 RepID=A0A4Y2IUN2_ARAVE|nr:hypothetical protein AVEN_82174-1 [Araneus ventricosus]
MNLFAVQYRVDSYCTNKFQLYPSAQLPRLFYQTTLQYGPSEAWQRCWDQGDTGPIVFYRLLPTSETLQSSCDWRIFFSRHDFQPNISMRFGLTNNNFCGCGEMFQHCTHTEVHPHIVLAYRDMRTQTISSRIV